MIATICYSCEMDLIKYADGLCEICHQIAIEDNVTRLNELIEEQRKMKVAAAHQYTDGEG